MGIKFIRLVRRINVHSSLNIFISGVKFAMGGLSFKDKLNAFYLRLSFENPYKDRPEIIKMKIKNSGSLIELRHKNFNNLKLKYDLLDNYQMAICKEFFLENAYDLSKINFIPEQIIDCGAFKGYFSILASNRFPSISILSIEPHPLNFDSIVHCIKINCIKNIIPLNKAISINKEPIQLFIEGSNGSINEESTFDNYFLVETINLKNIIDKEKPLLLKVDVEGAELEFFPDIIDELPDKCFVFIETHNGWNSLLSIKNKFLQNGFTFEVRSERGIYIDSLAQRAQV